MLLANQESLQNSLDTSHQISLYDRLEAAGDLSGRFLCDGETRVALSDLLSGSVIAAEPFHARCVLVATTRQIDTAMVLLELDGVAQRVVLFPPDLSLELIPAILSSAGVDAIVSDRFAAGEKPAGVLTIGCAQRNADRVRDRDAQIATEWILLTSGTTGRPKLVVHTLDSLTGGFSNRNASVSSVVWSTFYDIRRYGGLQIFLRAISTGSSLVLSNARESITEFLLRAGKDGVTHISGTPSNWRRALMSPSALLIAPQYVRLSGEIADQTILNHLATVYPQARLCHAFASTEAGVAFEVSDGLTGFPSSALTSTAGVAMKIENGSLRIRSRRTASRYLDSENAGPLKAADGFVDTCDMVEQKADRCYFAGRRDGVINVGGLKVHPEEVEGVLNRHPLVRMSLVRTKKNSIMGALVIADVVLQAMPVQGDEAQLKRDILIFCREALASHKVPATINFVSALEVAETGKLIRQNA